MRIVNLIEDTPVEKELKSEHGLSFYIETKKHKILFDTGATDAYIYNARKLNIDLEKVDTVILSHGHYDHCGGVISFLSINNHATIYMQHKASEDFYNIKNGNEKYIGIDKNILRSKQLKLIDGDYIIDDELMLFKGMVPDLESFKGNLFLKKKIGEEYIQDDFSHEHCLVISEHSDREIEKNVLVSGCAHNGIINILQQYNAISEKKLEAVFSGFHMMKDGCYNEQEINIIKQMAFELNKLNIMFYTGHCTGKEAYAIMKEIMSEHLEEIRVGFQWFI